MQWREKVILLARPVRREIGAIPLVDRSIKGRILVYLPRKEEEEKRESIISTVDGASSACLLPQNKMSKGIDERERERKTFTGYHVSATKETKHASVQGKENPSGEKKTENPKWRDPGCLVS